MMIYWLLALTWGYVNFKRLHPLVVCWLILKNLLLMTFTKITRVSNKMSLIHWKRTCTWGRINMQYARNHGVSTRVNQWHVEAGWSFIQWWCNEATCKGLIGSQDSGSIFPVSLRTWKPVVVECFGIVDQSPQYWSKALRRRKMFKFEFFTSQFQFSVLNGVFVGGFVNPFPLLPFHHTKAPGMHSEDFDGAPEIFRSGELKSYQLPIGRILGKNIHASWNRNFVCLFFPTPYPYHQIPNHTDGSHNVFSFCFYASCSVRCWWHHLAIKM